MEEIEFCMKCGKENDVKSPVCSCGFKNFIYGKRDSFTYENRVVKCRCGSEKFRLGISLNCGNIHEMKYSCVNCGNVISKQVNVESYYDECED